tara:strand:+ start:432 stop:623 length:192 start_codon:yes stop_codon:yes gene_type:complete
MSTLNKKDVQSILTAFAEGKQVYKTSRKHGKLPIYESLNPNTRKLLGLKSLYDLGFMEVTTNA